MSPNVVVQGIVVGTLITFFSVMVPARRAAKTEPIEALRDWPSRVRPCHVVVSWSLVLMGLGVLGLLGGSGVGLGFGAFALFVGVIVAGPLLAIIAAKLFRPIARLFGSKVASRPTIRRATHSAPRPQRTRCSSGCSS